MEFLFLPVTNINFSIGNYTHGTKERHSHNFFELEFIVDGTGIYEVDGTEYEIKKNTLFLMTPVNVHALKNTRATFINVMFSHEHNKEKNDIAFFSTNSPCFTFDEDDGILLYSLLREVVNANNYVLCNATPQLRVAQALSQ